MDENGELCSLCNWTMGPPREASEHCLICGKPICVWHGYPHYQGDPMPENFIGRTCAVCMAETSVASRRKAHD